MAKEIFGNSDAIHRHFREWEQQDFSLSDDTAACLNSMTLKVSPKNDDPLTTYGQSPTAKESTGAKPTDCEKKGTRRHILLKAYKNRLQRNCKAFCMKKA